MILYIIIQKKKYYFKKFIYLYYYIIYKIINIISIKINFFYYSDKTKIKNEYYNILIYN